MAEWHMTWVLTDIAIMKCMVDLCGGSNGIRMVTFYLKNFCLDEIDNWNHSSQKKLKSSIDCLDKW